MKKLQKMLAVSAMSVTLSSMSYASELIINSDASDPAPKAAFGEIVKAFEQENPDIKVTYNLYDHEGYKTTIRNWLVTSPPDVVFWYAGNRMKAFVDRGLFEDVSDIWDNNKLHQDFASAEPAMTIDGKQWGVPYTYYQWGIYYRKDIFDKLGIKEPKTWDEYLAACATLQKNNVTPVTIGTKYLWTTAGWFDYLDLRVNGLAFHMDLMDGKVPYTDPRVKKVFETWKQMVEPGYYLENHATYSWQEAQPFLYRGEAAMYLIGNFIAPNFPPELDGKMAFMQFPIINPEVGMSEDAPMDTLHIPSKAKNKADARKFLAFMARPENQTAVNKALLQIPPNNKAHAVNNVFLNKGVDMLNNADGTAQFFDRDTDPAMAKEAMKGFQEFMVKPDRLDSILSRLEKVRQRTFK